MSLKKFLEEAWREFQENRAVEWATGAFSGITIKILIEDLDRELFEDVVCYVICKEGEIVVDGPTAFTDVENAWKLYDQICERAKRSHRYVEGVDYEVEVWSSCI